MYSGTLIHLLIHSFTNTVTPSLTYSLTYSLAHSIFYSFLHPFVFSEIHLLIFLIRIHSDICQENMGRQSGKPLQINYLVRLFILSGINKGCGWFFLFEFFRDSSDIFTLKSCPVQSGHPAAKEGGQVCYHSIGLAFLHNRRFENTG